MKFNFKRKESVEQFAQASNEPIYQNMGAKAGLGIGLAVMSGIASATGTDYSTLTASVDFSTVIIGVLAVAGIMATVYVSVKGAKLVLSALKTL